MRAARDEVEGPCRGDWLSLTGKRMAPGEVRRNGKFAATDAAMWTARSRAEEAGIRGPIEDILDCIGLPLKRAGKNL